MVLAWCDRMLRTGNPLVERLTFFWHRHFATSRADVSPPQLMIGQNELLRRYSDLAAYPTAYFRDLVYEVGEGPAMLRYLTGEDNTRRAINENYGRELMELFCARASPTRRARRTTPRPTCARPPAPPRAGRSTTRIPTRRSATSTARAGTTG